METLYTHLVVFLIKFSQLLVAHLVYVPTLRKQRRITIVTFEPVEPSVLNEGFLTLSSSFNFYYQVVEYCLRRLAQASVTPNCSS